MSKKRINDRYEIDRPIGGGGMADVYLAKDLILDRSVAVKMLKSQFSKDDEFIRRFRREAQSATSLSHPNVVNIYDVGEEEDLYYIVMEYVEGQTLKDYIQEQGKLTVHETVRILKQMTAAVEHAHDNHIVHRDLKPHNILLSVDGTAKVTDFGIARAISEATITHTNSVLGSVHYLSPEQARGGQVTYKSDLYSLGVVTYEMLTGEVPFSGDTAVSVAIKHLQEPLPALREQLPDIPQSVENLVMKATAKDPSLRYESAEDMINDLQTILDPSRANEKPFMNQFPDEEMTKAVPIVGADSTTDHDQTMMHPNSKMRETATFENKNENPPKKRGTKFWVKISLLALVFFVGLIFVVFFLIPSWLHVDDVEIPEGLVGMHYDEAFETLTELNLEVEQDVRFDDEIEEDHVISHRPSAGQFVKEGTVVTLVVSEGIEPVEMADFIGETKDFAEQNLADYQDIEIEYEETLDYTDDTVLEQSPEAGEMVQPQETVVRLTVSERPTFIMSNLSNMTRDEVLETISSQPLLDLETEEEYHPSIEEGRVISQSPSRGDEIRERTTVNVVFSRGPEPVEEPPEEEEEEPISTEVAFTVEVPESDNGDNENENEDASYRIRISVTDMENRTPNQVIDEEISEDTTFNVPMTVAPGDSGFLILFVGEDEFEESPYEYTYEQLKEQ
ncbi:Stk1 family PASTA domain-containing Ser/Thr kinase [Salipaludibacillus daqingensis]|uniref:Stk1 family PASTA domain-containing Ser/Thr kinase n=1 Tax=Salipaludibacillus daqingensis TaxID=3041001 RepID=UPI0024751565|nr:Stk1 family PASTA domain-containing Ser/Thr kinase [Salipaludibacillus daqingensis]